MAQAVMMLTPYLHFGGLERMIYFLSKGLQEQGQWRPSVFVFESSEGNLESQFSDQDIPVIFHDKGPEFSPLTSLRIARQAKESGCSVIHTHDLGALIYGSLAKLASFGRLRLVHTQHSFVHIDRKKRYRAYEKFFTRFADALCVVSEAAREDYVSLGIDRDRIHLIPNGVEITRPAAPAPKDRENDRLAWIRSLPTEDLRKRVAVQSGSTWILCMARIARAKGQEDVIDVWAGLTPEIRAKCTLLIVGKESEAGSLAPLLAKITKAPDSDRIIQTGPTSFPHLALRASDVFLSASHFEGMPLGPLEAAGEGVPVVLSDIPGHAIFQSIAEFFPLKSPSSAASALTRQLDEVWSDSDFHIHYWTKSEQLRNEFSLGTMARRYSELYKQRKQG